MGACLLNPSSRGPTSVVASGTGGRAGARRESKNRGGGPVFPQSFLQAGEMLQCLLLEGEEGTDSEEREDSSIEDSKEIVTLAFVRENTGTQNGLQNAQQQGKKKRKKKRLGLKDEEWGSMLMIGDQSIQLPI
ncbi:hypothetical protein J1605_007377 [Eschrichtius robustus]|uniref:Uncharacterized protein n=1 Tax=Eschrichtius robustus TaxID=9764 RepID=A0AB34GXP4_ESCRO|nr:hypothetical protein J1605_007377 [Eschrichtius robustus]